MNIRDIKYFIAVAELKHFGKAADRCYVSQPTLSMQLKKLEEELNVQLFERTSKQVLITPEGEKLLVQARAVLREVDQMKQVAQNLQDPYSGSLRLGIIPTMGPYLLPKLLPLLSERFPNLEIILCEDKTDVILKRLKEGELDAIILALPVEDEGLVSKELFSEPFLLAVPETSALAKKKQIKMSDIENENLLLLADGHCLRDQALEACRFSGAAMRSGFQATSLETIRHMVAANAGITLLPKMVVDVTPEQSSIVIRPFEEPAPSRLVGMLWRETSAHRVCCEAVAEVIAGTKKAG